MSSMNVPIIPWKVTERNTFLSELCISKEQTRSSLLKVWGFYKKEIFHAGRHTAEIPVCLYGIHDFSRHAKVCQGLLSDFILHNLEFNTHFGFPVS